MMLFRAVARHAAKGSCTHGADMVVTKDRLISGKIFCVMMKKEGVAVARDDSEKVYIPYQETT